MIQIQVKNFTIVFLIISSTAAGGSVR